MKERGGNGGADSNIGTKVEGAKMQKGRNASDFGDGDRHISTSMKCPGDGRRWQQCGGLKYVFLFSFPSFFSYFFFFYFFPSFIWHFFFFYFFPSFIWHFFFFYFFPSFIWLFLPSFFFSFSLLSSIYLFIFDFSSFLFSFCSFFFFYSFIFLSFLLARWRPLLL